MKFNRTALVTGSTGFIGREVTRQLGCEYDVRATARTVDATSRLTSHVTPIVTGDLHTFASWSAAMAGVDVVVHLAARAHVRDKDAGGVHAQDVILARRAAEEAARAHVKRFVFVSTIGVHGNATHEQPFREADQARPRSTYAAAKWRAEQEIMDVGAATGMEVVVLRPPLVYGPDAPGTFGQLVRLVRRNLPLPFGRISNERSVVSVASLAEAIRVLSGHPAAAGETFLVSDPVPVSTRRLIECVAAGFGFVPRLLPVPLSVVRGAARLMRFHTTIEPMIGSLVVDSSKIRRMAGWTGEESTEDAVRRSVQPC